MASDIGPRLHAFINGLGKPSEEKQTDVLSSEVKELFQRHDILDGDGRDRLIVQLTEDVLATFKLTPSHTQFKPIALLIDDVFDQEKLFLLPEPSEKTATIAEHWDIRNELLAQKKLFADFDETSEQLRIFFCSVIAPVYSVCPTLLEPDDANGITIPTQLISLIPNLGEVVEQQARVCSDEDLQKSGLIERIRKRLDHNLIRASGGNPANSEAFSRAPKYPSQSDIRDGKEIVRTYLGGTGLAGFFHQQVNFTIPTQTRFEHHHIIAGSGHGKTQTLQYLITKDLEEVKAGGRSIVVLDSQGDLIENISNLDIFAPGQPLHDRVVIIDPTDVEWPVSLNLFDVGQERLNSYAPLEKERLTNSILELYDFVLGSLLSAEMTQKQNVIFRYVTRLMLHIPDATIHTLRELMEPDSQDKFAEHIAKLSGTPRHFFETEFSSREFEQTKKQVLRRLWGILENQTFERMFSHPRSKLDLFSELNAGKVILINTAKDLLKESGTEIFGRFFIALIAQAAQERSTIQLSKRMPTSVYIDEAADYFDRNIGIILSQARKYNVGMILAHQFLGQLDPKLQDAVAANTSIKFVGGVSSKDARAMALQLQCEPSFIEDQPKISFASHIRGSTKGAIPLAFPYGHLEKLPKMGTSDRQALQERMREKYAVHYTELSGVGSEIDTQQVEETPQDADDPLAPTKGW